MKRPVVRRAEEELRAGRLWKARDRLTGAVRDDPADQAVLGLLGEVYFTMGDHPAAWRYWALTDRDDEDAHLAKQAFDERFGGVHLADALRQIPARDPLEAYPPAAHARLSELRARAQVDGIRWPRPPSAPSAPPGFDVHGAVIFVGLIFFLVLPLIAGYAALISEALN